MASRFSFDPTGRLFFVNFEGLEVRDQADVDGIRQAVELLAARLGSLHDAHHAAMECLGTMLWEAQRAGRAPDGDAYIACVQRRATRG